MDNEMIRNIPEDVQELMLTLKKAGKEAYVVGGCVRDALTDREPKDWDITTSARPEELKSIFAGEQVSETGIQHGTLVVFKHDVPYEITTFRTDGEYTDHRHPDRVIFVDNVQEDLRRRDFTVNAIAYAPDTGIVDPFHGLEDLRDGVLRCIGISHVRFTEDAFRIMRCLRFSSVFGYTIEAETAKGIHDLAPTLVSISGDRKRAELMKMLCGKRIGAVLREFPDVFAVMIPEIAEMAEFDQKNAHHAYTLWEHTIHAVESAPAVPAIRLAMLLHDTGKLTTQTVDEKGEAHYRGHPDQSAAIADRVMAELNFDNATKEKVRVLVANHDLPLGLDEKTMEVDRDLLRKRLRAFGEETLRDLILVHRADRYGTGTRTVEQVDTWTNLLSTALDALVAEKPCFTKKDLAIRGNDLMAMGIQGPEVGIVLKGLLDLVSEGKLPNDFDTLHSAAEELIRKL